ncbi:MAG: anaerobic ribonucleoside-triphosphate reductase activating protein [Candidatus Nealsonbacteria bacterium]|nr:anaerobic ribonucleoside-triphosphate reductase activating protein [Candidatus Nealsonbacteria bacterium]
MKTSSRAGFSSRSVSKIEIGGLQKTTLIDYPGRLAATVFLIGCNFRCPFCYSAELVLPDKIKNQPRISQKDFFSFLKERKGLLEAITVCGGEPSLNKDLPVFIRKIKKLGYLVKLDTNGSNPGMLKRLIKEKLVDYIAMDIKAPKENYEKAVGKVINVGDIEKSIDILKQNKVDYEFRTTIVPTIHSKEDIIKIVKWISPAKKYYLQSFRAEKMINSKLEKIKPYPKEFLSDIKKEIFRFFEVCEIR